MKHVFIPILRVISSILDYSNCDVLFASFFKQK